MRGFWKQNIGGVGGGMGGHRRNGLNFDRRKIFLPSEQLGWKRQKKWGFLTES